MVNESLVDHIQQMKAQGAKPIRMLYYLAEHGQIRIRLLFHLRAAFSLSIVDIQEIASWFPTWHHAQSGITDEEADAILAPLIYTVADDIRQIPPNTENTDQ